MVVQGLWALVVRRQNLDFGFLTPKFISYMMP
jgi:hypothetical protein